jgi:hypothetical protein
MVSFGWNKGQAFVRTSGVLWLFDMQNVILWAAERWDNVYREAGTPANPYIILAKQATMNFEDKLRKRRERELVSSSYYAFDEERDDDGGY